MKLIIINGPCGVGKSTIAEKLHASMPLSYLLDIDAVSRNISHYREYREERWELNVAIAKATINAVLDLKRDIIVEKMIYAPETLDAYRKIGKEHGADVTEIILWAPKDVVMKRAEDRGWREGLLTPEKCEMFWDKINELKDNRPEATIIDISALSEEDALQTVQKEVI